MRILAVSQYYWPEPFSFADTCEELVSRGHEVTMITSVPNYPEGRIYEGYGGGARRKQERGGVEITRVGVVPRGKGPVARMLNYYSFSWNACRAVRRLEHGFDVVLSFQVSPVTQCRPALEYGRRNGVPVLIYCMDIWPECLTVGGIRRGSLVYRHFARVSRGIYSSADLIAVASARFRSYLRDNLGINDTGTFYLPQYAEDIFDVEAPRREEYDPAKLNLTFAGNVGTAQSVKTLVEAGRLIGNDGNIAIHVVGSGTELDALRSYRDEIGASCVVFHGRHPLSEMPSFYASSDAMVATFQDNEILGYTLPRKISSYMAAGRPVIGTLVGEARRIIEEAGCGVCCNAEDYEALARVIKEFAKMSRDEREAMGARGRAYYEANLSRGQFFKTLEENLLSLAEGAVR